MSPDHPQAASPKLPPLRRIKEATAEDHQRAEDAADLAQALRSKEDYARCLQGFHRAWVAIEKWLRDRPDHLPPDMDMRWRAALLQKDLSELGTTAPPVEASFSPLENGRATVVGVLYVLEGATLGGQIVTRRLQGALEILPDHGGAFFYGHGAETGPQWKQFIAWAEARLTDEMEVRQAIAAAKETFSFVQQSFTIEKA